MNTDDLVAAGNPYPERSVEELALQAESHALMEEIMTTPTKTPSEKDPRVRRRLRWIAPAVAAAAVAVLVVGAVVVIGPQPERDSSTVADPAAPQEDVPPPTAGNLRYVTVNADGWEVTHAYRSKHHGAVSWSDGESTVEINSYSADEHRRYLDDRNATGAKKQRASLLGQKGWEFRVRYADSGGTQWWTSESAPEASDDAESGRNVLRVETMLPPVGESFLAFDAEVPNEAAYEDLLASLQRVDRRTW